MKRAGQELADPKQLIALEQELADLKEQYGIKDRPRLWVRIGDWLWIKRAGQEPWNAGNISGSRCAAGGSAGRIGFMQSSISWAFCIFCCAGPGFRLR